MNYYICIAGTFKSKKVSKKEAEEIVFRSLCEDKNVNSVIDAKGENVYLTIGGHEK